jgi:hypothetical protein
MDSAVVVALVGALAAAIGGLLTAYAARRVEVMRLQASLREKANERKLATLEEFLLAVNSWIDWLIYMEDQGWEGRLDELNSRVKHRDDAYRRMILLASDRLLEWLVNTYNPLEYQLKQTYVRQVRQGRRPGQNIQDIRREFTRLLREDLIAQFRPEVASLRDPIHSS